MPLVIFGVRLIPGAAFSISAIGVIGIHLLVSLGPLTVVVLCAHHPVALQPPLPCGGGGFDITMVCMRSGTARIGKPPAKIPVAGPVARGRKYHRWGCRDAAESPARNGATPGT